MSLAWTPRRHRLLHAIAAGQVMLEPSGRTRWADRTVTAAVGDLWVAGLVACERTNSPVELTMRGGWTLHRWDYDHPEHAEQARREVEEVAADMDRVRHTLAREVTR